MDISNKEIDIQNNSGPTILIKIIVLFLIIGSTFIVNLYSEMNMAWSLIFNWTVYSSCIMYMVAIFSTDDKSIYD